VVANGAVYVNVFRGDFVHHEAQGEAGEVIAVHQSEMRLLCFARIARGGNSCKSVVA
jgi:hypothetical protein